MRNFRNLMSVALASVLSLSAAAARAEVAIWDVMASDGDGEFDSRLVVQGDTLVLRVSAAGTGGVYPVEAELEGVRIELVRPGDEGPFEGTFDISDLAYGPHRLTIRAYDLFGDAETVEKTVERYAEPLIRMTSPLPSSTVAGNPRVYIQCLGTAPYECAQLCGYFRTQTRDLGSQCFARQAGAPPGPLWFAAAPSPAPLPGEVVTVRVSVRLSNDRELGRTLGPLYYESSPKLVALHSVPGAILDFDATRILFLDHYQRLGVFDRATQEMRWAATLPPDPSTGSSYGALTPYGAAVQSGTGRIFVWRDGVWRKIVTTGRLDAVSGDALVWTTDDEDRAYAHTVSTGINTPLWNRPGTVTPFQTDISPSGDIYYATYEEPWIRRFGVSRLGYHPGKLQRPITDGTNVAGRWWNGSTSSSYLFTADGEEVFLGDSISGNSAGLLLHAGYAGFLRSDGAANQVWLRTPEGEMYQLSDFAASSLFDQQKLRVGHDGISDDGEVLFLNGGKRYIGRPGVEPEEIGSALGHARWVDGNALVTIGNTLFQVVSEAAPAAPSAETGEALLAGAAGPDGPDAPAAGEAQEPAPAALLPGHEPDALPVLDDASAPQLASDASSGGLPAGVGCSAGRSAAPGSGLAALAAAIAGLAVARRGRRRA
ncbi:hypothetical protein SOCEGT47_002030 [Sorangium cellulosum]|uniref:Secreted protein n=1 Tax=Sorangium cellulosum TaxID=56 RepID=A0A4P2PTG1_SORCE|nr:hypothetical protein [Sorangium cellulosum]AUX19751.1 hypothetical protein SOCEGT47_002030 [Sorangium cellulosum]